MKKYVVLAASAFAFLASPAVAEDREGTFQFKILGTAVLPDGAIDEVKVDLVGLPAGTQTKANDNIVPTIAIEYFVTEDISVETIAGVTQHDVDGTTGLPGAELVSDAKIVPATLTAKLHFDAGGVKPYLGAGPTYWLIFDEQPGAATIPLGVTDFNLDNEIGFALQAGIDVPLGDSGFAISLDAKRYFIDLTAQWFAGDTLAIETEHTIDPWVISAGVAIQF
jgi:outer membrane protein